MAEQIITLGIGATPTTLTPFITTGLEISTVVVPDVITNLNVKTTDMVNFDVEATDLINFDLKV